MVMGSRWGRLLFNSRNLVNTGLFGWGARRLETDRMSLYVEWNVFYVERKIFKECRHVFFVERKINSKGVPEVSEKSQKNSKKYHSNMEWYLSTFISSFLHLPGPFSWTSL